MALNRTELTFSDKVKVVNKNVADTFTTVHKLIALCHRNSVC